MVTMHEAIFLAKSVRAACARIEAALNVNDLRDAGDDLTALENQAKAFLDAAGESGS